MVVVVARWWALPVAILAVLFGAGATVAQEGFALGEPLLVLLADTGDLDDGLPVLTTIEDDETLQALSRGLPGVVFRVYRWVQHYRWVEEGVEVEPAYVLLSERQGGFARRGFVLDGERKPEVAYVDVHRDWSVTGEFGALDQIVPHEMAHAIRRHLVGPLAEGGANQVHALAVRTDPVTAFNEGFAEHLQPMAIEHPDADSGTASLATRFSAYESAVDRLSHYRREVSALLAAAPRFRMGFLAWYSNDEDVLRHFAVKENAFAREADLSRSLLERSDPYPAYLLESVLPGAPSGPPKSVGRMLSTEGVISTFFYRWANHEGIRSAWGDAEFYAAFGAPRAEVAPLENVYLKLFDVFYRAKPQSTLELIDGYRSRFPDEAPFVDELVAEVFLGQPLLPSKEIWLANADFETGTTLFDQYRGLPRMHTFDLNAASLVDLTSVPGVGLSLARRLRDAAPFDTIDELAAIEGVDKRVLEAFRRMEADMAALRARAEEESVEDAISVQLILRPYIQRAVVVLLLATALAAALFFRIRRADPDSTPGWIRSSFAGLGASLIALSVGWAFGSGLASLLAVAVVFGLPALLWQMWRTRRSATAFNALLAWAAAALPAIVLITPWF